MTVHPRRILVFAFGMLALMMLVAIASNAEQFQASPAQTGRQLDTLAIEQNAGATTATEVIPPPEPVDVPDWVAIGVAVALGIALLYLLSRQRFSFRFGRPSLRLSRSTVESTEEEQADAIATIATDLIDGLRAGDSPRTAIQRAYAAVETGFGAPELARKPAETPLRYLDRIFGRHGSLEAPLEQLTALFQRARFSDEPVDESMRSDAIDSLSEIRDYYTAFAWKKISNRRSKART